MNALEESYRDKADEIFEKVQKRINKKGAYENAGQKEITDYMDQVRLRIGDYQTVCRLQEYINHLMDNCLIYK